MSRVAAEASVERPRSQAPAASAPARRAGSRIVACVALALALACLALALLLPPGRVAVKVLAVLPEIFPDSPARPLTWVTPTPSREELSYDFRGGHMDSDLYLPAGDGPHGAVVLYGGVFALRRDPSMVRFAEALSRAGAVVLVPESSGLLEGAITPDEVDALLDAVAYLRTRAEVDPSRLGVFGFSAGGSLVLLAAEHERGREQIAFVNIIGAYYDALDLVRAVASRSYLLDGQTVAWEPAAVTTFEFAKLLIAALPDANDQDILGRAYLDKPRQPLDGPEALSPAGRLALELLQSPSPERIEVIIAALPPSTRAQLTAISPSAGIASLRTHLYLMHDLSDSYVPYTHSRALAAAAAPPGTLRHYSEFDLFGHVMPNRQLSPPVFARELAKLFYHAWLVGQEFL